MGNSMVSCKFSLKPIHWNIIPSRVKNINHLKPACGFMLRVKLKNPPKKKTTDYRRPFVSSDCLSMCILVYIYIVIVIYILYIYIHSIYIYTVYIYIIYIYPIFWYYKWWVIPTYVLSKTQFHNCGTVIHSKPWCLLDLLHCLQRQNRSLLLVIWNFTLW